MRIHLDLFDEIGVLDVLIVNDFKPNDKLTTTFVLKSAFEKSRLTESSWLIRQSYLSKFH